MNKMTLLAHGEEAKRKAAIEKKVEQFVWDAKTKLDASLAAAKVTLASRLQDFLDKVDAAEQDQENR